MPSPEDRNRGQGEGAAPPADAPADAPVGAATQPPSASDLSTAGSSTSPVPTTGFGERRPELTPQQAAAWLPPTYDQVARGTAVPVTVKVACVLTWVFSGLVALLYAGMLIALVVAQDRIVDFVLDSPEWQRANLESDLLVPVLWVGCLMFLTWSLGACVLAFFAWRRHNWARWLLAASAVTTVLAAMFAFPVGVLHQVAAALTVAGLFSAAARAWYAAPSGGTGGPPGGQPGGQPGVQPGPPRPPAEWQSAPPPAQYPPPPPPDGKPPVW